MSLRRKHWVVAAADVLTDEGFVTKGYWKGGKPIAYHLRLRGWTSTKGNAQMYRTKDEADAVAFKLAMKGSGLLIGEVWIEDYWP